MLEPLPGQKGQKQNQVIKSAKKVSELTKQFVKKAVQKAAGSRKFQAAVVAGVLGTVTFLNQVFDLVEKILKILGMIH